LSIPLSYCFKGVHATSLITSQNDCFNCLNNVINAVCVYIEKSLIAAMTASSTQQTESFKSLKSRLKAQQKQRCATYKRRSAVATVVGLACTAAALIYKQVVDPKTFIVSGTHKVKLRDLPPGCEDIVQLPVDMVESDDGGDAYILSGAVRALTQHELFPRLLAGEGQLCAAQVLVPDNRGHAECGDEPASLHFGVADAQTSCGDLFEMVDPEEATVIACLMQAFRGVPKYAFDDLRDWRMSVSGLSTDCGFRGGRGRQHSHFVFSGNEMPYGLAGYTTSDDGAHRTYQFKSAV
jgi:hypothetical protein